MGKHEGSPDAGEAAYTVARPLPWIVLLALMSIGFAFAYFIIKGISPEYAPLYKRNFIVIIGLPLAALASLFIVLVLRQTQGPLEFEGLGFKFRGASGPVILWVLCYLAFVLSFKTLWVAGD